MALLVASLCILANDARAEKPWQTLGLMRVRDMTPFGLNRLDMLPTHAVAAEPGTFAFEINLTYQNTWARSRNVELYLAERGIRRGAIGPEDVQAILDLPGEAYLVDGEIGLADLSLFYQVADHLSAYVSIPYYSFQGGFLDSTIEGFHKGLGLANAGREHVPRNQFLTIADLAFTRFVALEAPRSDFGDPVLGLRLVSSRAPEHWNIVFEGAVKIAWSKQERLLSTGANDYGMQLSVQRFFARNALYLSLAAVWFGSPDPGLAGDQWLPTVVLGWETRVARHTNFILQIYGSRSTVQETSLRQLSADKIQVTFGLQWNYRGTAMRVGITENLGNFNNTPDVGVNLAIGRVFGRVR
jgi:hypothetical protein